AMVIVGGMGTLIGPVWGAILLTVLPEVLRGFGDFRLVLYGAALALVVLFMPGGMVQAAQLLLARFGLRRSTPAPGELQLPGRRCRRPRSKCRICPVQSCFAGPT